MNQRAVARSSVSIHLAFSLSWHPRRNAVVPAWSSKAFYRCCFLLNHFRRYLERRDATLKC